ncbi:MAG TPA: glutaredoxin family protein [Gaiellaceae bacterium]|nr:glutaredoxin family protein [Gaiellaceae bacterium]
MASTRSSRVTVYSAAGCHLCERAVEVVAEVCGAAAAVVDITGDPVLEARYRTRIPVVEVDGEVAFTYFVRPDALRERLRRA